MDNVVDAVYTTVASGATDLSATVLAGQTSQAGVTFSFRVEAVDGNGNRDLTNTSRIVLDPPPGGGFTFSLTNFGVPITEADLASGAVTLYGRGTKAGIWQITVRDKVPVLSSRSIRHNDSSERYGELVRRRRAGQCDRGRRFLRLGGGEGPFRQQGHHRGIYDQLQGRSGRGQLQCRIGNALGVEREPRQRIVHGKRLPVHRRGADPRRGDERRESGQGLQRRRDRR